MIQLEASIPNLVCMKQNKKLSAKPLLRQGFCQADMQKVIILPPADFQGKISVKGQNQTPLLGFTNFRQFSENFHDHW